MLYFFCKLQTAPLIKSKFHNRHPQPLKRAFKQYIAIPLVRFRETVPLTKAHYKSLACIYVREYR